MADQTLTPNVLDTTTTMRTPTILLLKQILTPDVINASATPRVLTITILFSVGVISASSTMQAPTIFQQRAFPPVLDASATLRTPDVRFIVPIVRPIISANDDATESPGESPIVINTPLICTKAGDHIGMRFQDINVPKDAIIHAAFVTGYIIDSAKNDAEGTLYGQAADNPGEFQTTDGDVDTRTKTTAAVGWTDNDVATTGNPVNTPSLKVIIQEITTRSGWVAKNSLVIFYAHNSNTELFSIAAYENETLPEPSITIQYLAYVSTIFPAAISAAATMRTPVVGALLSPGVLSAPETMQAPTVKLSTFFLDIPSIFVTTNMLVHTVSLTTVFLPGLKATVMDSSKAEVDDVARSASIQDTAKTATISAPSFALTFEEH